MRIHKNVHINMYILYFYNQKKKHLYILNIESRQWGLIS